MTLLQANGITKRFAGIRALSDVTMAVDEGEFVGLIGPNGAGKTTFFNCLYGLLRPDEGRVILDGRDITTEPVQARARLGIGRTFQRMETFAGLSVCDHLIVALRAQHRRGGLVRDLTFRGRASAQELAATGEVLARLGLIDDAERPIEALSLGRARLVELGRALMIEPRLLFLDEPSSGLDPAETSAMAEVLEAVNRDQGVTIVLVEHDLSLVRRVTRRLVCLNLGSLIASGSTEEVLADPEVRAAYLGSSAP